MIAPRKELAPRERLTWLCLIPIFGTVLFYALPQSSQQGLAVQFVPQALGYVCLILWANANRSPWRSLGLLPFDVGRGCRWGIPTGLLLGLFNAWVILDVVPRLGGDIGFLRNTPHARLPLFVMLPWFILGIALFVEVNFRGFLLGRLQTMAVAYLGRPHTGLSVLLSALAFSFDPFMVTTFRHLHWIAVWDGIVWGTLVVRQGALSVAVVAHAVEVMVMYSVLKAVLR